MISLKGLLLPIAFQPSERKAIQKDGIVKPIVFTFLYTVEFLVLNVLTLYVLDHNLLSKTKGIGIYFPSLLPFYVHFQKPSLGWGLYALFLLYFMASRIERSYRNILRK